MSLRDVAWLAGATLESVRARQASGDHLLIFVEGLLAQAIGFLIADQLPPSYRGHYANVSEALAPARAAAAALSPS